MRAVAAYRCASRKMMCGLGPSASPMHRVLSPGRILRAMRVSRFRPRTSLSKVRILAVDAAHIPSTMNLRDFVDLSEIALTSFCAGVVL